MKQFKERRRQGRKNGYGLVALIDGRVHPVADISTSGISFQATGYGIGSVIKLRLARLSNLEESVEGSVTVRHTNDAITRGEFSVTAQLMRFIIGSISKATGAEPVYFT